MLLAHVPRAPTGRDGLLKMAVSFVDHPARPDVGRLVTNLEHTQGPASPLVGHSEEQGESRDKIEIALLLFACLGPRIGRCCIRRVSVKLYLPSFRYSRHWNV